jgi:hypothetical protein
MAGLGRVLATIALLALAVASVSAPASSDEQPVRFGVVNVVLDTSRHSLAAYQVDLRALDGDVRIVGIEGGEHRHFSEPPYYDPAAMQQERVIIGAFSTAPAAELPRGRTRIATIHVQHAGDRRPRFDAELTVASTVGGRRIDAEIILDQEPEP